jgi:hypothetical protein
MRVSIQSVDGCRVAIVSAIGTARGTWVGPTPELEKDYHVELDVPGVVAWDSIEDAGPNRMPSLTERLDGLVSLRGRVDDIDEDLVLQLWLGSTSVMIDSVGEPPLGIVGRFVDVVVENLTFFPADY